MNNLNKVVIVGRTNVGKSTLFNRLSSSVKALTFDLAGVTRDFIKDVVTWNNVTFELIDSGGLILKKTQDEITDKIKNIGFSLINDADLVLFVCDGTVGILPEEKEIAKILHQQNKNVIIVVNKMDSKNSKDYLYEFEQFGFKNVIQVSAEHGLNVGDLLDQIVNDLLKIGVKGKQEEEPLFKVVLIGKPNVGKSSLLNLLLKNERSIVSPIAGTTREAVSENVKFYKETIQLTDTAGIRRKKAVTEDIENLMVKSSLEAIKNSDIIVLLVDISEAQLSDQELKLAFYVFELGKALILLFNKSDLLTEQNKKDLEHNLSKYDFLINKLEILHISCKTEKNIGKILPLVDEVWKKHSQKFSDIEITSLFKFALQRTPLFYRTLPLMLFSAKQIKSDPITILLTVNEPKWFGESQKSFFENILRKEYDLKGVPILFVFKKRNER